VGEWLNRIVDHLQPSEFEPHTHSLTRQLVPVQNEVCERSLLPELGWDATCDNNNKQTTNNEQVSEWSIESLTNCNQANFSLTHSLTHQLVAVHVEACECSELPELGWDAACDNNNEQTTSKKS